MTLSKNAACPLCGGGAAPAGMPGLLDCTDCALSFREDMYSGSAVYEEGLEEGIYGAAKKDLFCEALDRLEEELPAKGRLLDIGCASGDFMRAAAARGWRAEGVELNPALALKAEAAGFTVSPLTVEKARLDRGAYAVITVFEVFCLMDKPAAAAAELFRLLKPGGLLYVRDFNAAFHLPLARLEAAGVFERWGLKPSVLHNFNFRARTLKLMLEVAGFTEVSVRNSRPTAGDPYRTGGRFGGFFTRAVKVLYYTLAQALWYASLGRCYAGSSLIVTARKK